MADDSRGDDDDVGRFVCYVPTRFGADKLAEIERANEIISSYEKSGMAITLRQLYYQLVARGLIPNRVEEYNKLGDLVSRGRLAGLVSWTAIEDRGRNLMGYQTFDGPEQAVRWLEKEHYKTDLWADQPTRPEVWVEKHALEGVVGAICNELRVDFFGIGGYNSQSAQWRAGRRLARYVSKGQRPIVFHLGDHDPSGIDMTRDNQERLSLFAGTQVQVVRIALNMSQVEQYEPPPNPAKVTDSRFADYQKKFGDESWELDALRPEVIQELIRDAVTRVRDERKWDAALKQEAEDKIVLGTFAEESDEEATE